ncbi:VRR-NUC domain-containing protein [Vibrio variabilis]|uniref:VRR-NUC domain-containing protein n=1 Tax=Vibrio variabilis TaxID=990271 RepID=UPI0013A6C419|nr:VRR-NUC domain-containing protein [Vibrio variabilis]
MNNPSPIILEPKYYLSNFMTLLHSVEELYGDLLDTSERNWLHRFYQLEEDEQCLLIRMMTRKGEWFRSDKLIYPELGATEPLLSKLELSGFIVLTLPSSPHILADKLLTKPELLSLYPDLPKALRKSQLIERLPEQFESPTLSLPFTPIELVDNDKLPLFCLLFFGNRHQDFAQFVLENLGIHTFEQYEVSTKTRIFHSRNEIISSLTLGELAASYEEIDRKSQQALQDFSKLIPMPQGKHASRTYNKLVNLVARDLERVGAFDDAFALFIQTVTPPSRERQARILKAQAKLESAQKIVQTMLESPLSIDEFEVAERLSAPLCKALGKPKPKAVKLLPPEVHRKLDLSSNRVELAVVKALNKEGWQAFYLENQFLNTLFGLAFWDILFAPVEGAFVNPYQRQPLDLYRKEFVESRKQLVENRLNDIRLQGISCLIDRHKNKRGIQNPFVVWELLDDSWLNLAMESISSDQLIGLFEVILSDIRAYRAGQPDVVAFKDGDWMWCEVKGPGDKLQHNQIRWMKQFEKLNICYQVCYVNHR